VPEDVQLTVFRLMLGGLVTYSSRTASVMFDGRRRRLVAVVDRSTPRRSARICAAVTLLYLAASATRGMVRVNHRKWPYQRFQQSRLRVCRSLSNTQ
jgi:hypothetical protein